jgi:hypothetical protein
LKSQGKRAFQCGFTMGRRTLFVLAVLAALIGSGPPAFAAGIFAIERPQFSLFVNENDYSLDGPIDDQGPTVVQRSLRKGVLYFSFTVVGADAAIDYLNDHDRLEVEAVVWFGGFEWGRIHIGITQQQWRRDQAALVNQWRKEGAFTWRTYMYITPPANTHVEIKIRDAYHAVVSPVGYRGSYSANIRVLP